LGKIESNGRIYLINPNGIVIGKEGVINTASFFASSMDIPDDQFLNSEEWTLQGEGIDCECKVVS
jgi:large exoprotein involved in heme utilization and adhesion